MIKADSITVKRGLNSVIQELDFSLHKKEKVVLTGPNGAGKSTLALALSGILPIESGDIFIDSEPVGEYSLPDLRKKIGIVFQNPEVQFVTSGVRDEISFGLTNILEERNEMESRVNEIIDDFGIEYLLNRDPEDLSGGEKQIAAMASIYAMSPDYIVFDEVTTYLDRKSRERIYSIWKNSSISLLIITQNFEEVVWADRVVLMEEGQIKFESETDKLMKMNLLGTSKARLKRQLKKNRNYIPDFERVMEIIG